MIKLLLLFLALFFTLQTSVVQLYADTFTIKKEEITQEERKNPKVTCRVVCDKRVYKEQQIAEAVEFYKKAHDSKSVANR